MFKNKNKMTKISNAIFLGFGILAFLSLLSIITNIDIIYNRKGGK